MMRFAISVLMLAGCALGQQAGSNTYPATIEQCQKAVDMKWISPSFCQQLLVDIPATKRRAKLVRKDWDLGGLDNYTSDADLAASCRRLGWQWKDNGCLILKNACDDADRILIGPDGHGKYWCHKVQN